MKKIVLAALLISVSLIGCKKHDGRHENEIQNITLNVVLKPTDTYTLDLTKYGDKDDLSTITTQAAFFDESIITKNGTSADFSDVYTYKPKFNVKQTYEPNDKVVLKVYEPLDRHHVEETNITINFTIAP